MSGRFLLESLVFISPSQLGRGKCKYRRASCLTQQYPDSFSLRPSPTTESRHIVNSPLLLSHPPRALCVALVHAHAHRRQRLLSGSVADNTGTHMSTAPTFAAISFQTQRPVRSYTRTTDISPCELDGTPNSHGAKDYFQYHKPQLAADYFARDPHTSTRKLGTRQSDSGSGTFRPESKREGVRWDLRPQQEDANKYNRSLLDADRVETGEQPAFERAIRSTPSDQFASVTSRRAHEDQASDMNKRRFSINFFKRRQRFVDDTNQETKQQKSLTRPSWLRKITSNSHSDPPISLADMPVPPTFIPPGLQRVPTPTSDAPAQIKGKLADFFFDMHGLQSTPRRKSRPSPGSIWDSDAILMSMEPDLDISDESDEAPEGRSEPQPPQFHLGPVTDDPPGIMLPPDRSSGAESRLSSGSAPWFRIGQSHSSGNYKLTAAALKEADERRKFEWLVPEHLPDSPVCPLHAKYRGPSKGMCYWHGRECNGYGAASGRNRQIRPSLGGHKSSDSSGWSVGRREVPRVEIKKRRLGSFSSP